MEAWGKYYSLATKYSLRQFIYKTGTMQRRLAWPYARRTRKFVKRSMYRRQRVPFLRNCTKNMILIPLRMNHSRLKLYVRPTFDENIILCSAWWRLWNSWVQTIPNCFIPTVWWPVNQDISNVIFLDGLRMKISDYTGCCLGFPRFINTWETSRDWYSAREIILVMEDQQLRRLIDERLESRISSYHDFRSTG